MLLAVAQSQSRLVHEMSHVMSHVMDHRMSHLMGHMMSHLMSHLMTHVKNDMLWEEAAAGLKSFRQEKKREREKRRRMLNLKGALAGS